MNTARPPQELAPITPDEAAWPIRMLLPAIYIALMLAAIWARVGGLDPATLWYDDVWVAVLTKVSSPLDLLDIPAPGPLGFLSVLWGVRRLITDPEISLQLLPFACGVVSIPLVGVAVRRITGGAAMAALAAAIMAMNPLVAHYSIFIKHFTIDAVASAGLILLAASLLVKPTFSRLAWGATVALLSFTMSFVSVIAGGLLVNLGALAMLREERFRWRAAWPAASVAFAFNSAVLATYVLYLRHIRNPELVSFWQSFYVPTDSVASATVFLRESFPAVAKVALPELLRPTWPLLFVGLAWLLWNPTRHMLAAFFALFYVAWIAMSALQMYPLGGERTDMFSFPATIALYCAGFYAITSWHRATRTVALVTAVAAVVLGLMLSPGATYFDVEGDSDIVRELRARARDNDAIVIYPSAGFIVGYYGPWPVAIERTDLIMQGYDVRLRRPGSLTLPHDTLERVAPVLESFLQRGSRQRIFYVAARQKPDVIPESFITSTLELFGYGLADSFRSSKTSVSVFERVRRGRTEVGPERILIDIGGQADATYLGGGWWTPERADFRFRWAVASPTYLVVPLQPPLFLRAPEEQDPGERDSGGPDSGGYLLRLRGRPFTFPGSPTQTIDIDIDGRPLAQFAVAPEMAVYEVVIPSTALQRSLTEIRFRFAYTRSPLEAGISDDVRPLAVLFDTIELVRR